VPRVGDIPPKSPLIGKIKQLGDLKDLRDLGEPV
jgi:hypothetical protein